jgi:adenosylcobinamide-GDP ribazoletransferase
MKNEIKIFFTALMFYTRIPCPSWVDHSPDYLNKATKYFPFIGWIVGLISAITFFISQFFFPIEIAILLSMLASIWTTGAFHEDGLADVCDGFGGGWTREKILEIMKDSRVGTYGSVGLILALLLKFFSLKFFVESNETILSALNLFDNSSIIPIVISLLVAHPLSRWVASIIVFIGDYAREDENSKSKPIAKNFSKLGFFWASVFGVFPLFVLMPLKFIPFFIFTGISLSFILYRYFKKWLGGYTGDCLGATQQISEIIFYLLMIILWKFI